MGGESFRWMNTSVVGGGRTVGRRQRGGTVDGGSSGGTRGVNGIYTSPRQHMPIIFPLFSSTEDPGVQERPGVFDTHTCTHTGFD